MSTYGSVNGGYDLTIERVDGTTVYGHWAVTTPRQGDRRGRFVGTIDGNVLSWGKDSRFTVDATRMRGVIGENGHMAVTLTKQ